MSGHVSMEMKAALSVDEAGTLTGIAWPFGTPDRVGDVIEPGAFKGAKAPLPMLAYHDDKAPVGAWTDVRETAQGLEVKGRLLVDDVPLVPAALKTALLQHVASLYQTREAAYVGPANVETIPHGYLDLIAPFKPWRF